MSIQGSQSIKLAIVSSGLGHVNRGFEVSAARWHSLLHGVPGVDVRLFSGGKFDGATRCWNAPRNFLLAHFLNLCPWFGARGRWEFAYVMEQVTFAFGFFPHLIAWKPDIVWTKDVPLAHLIDMFRFDLRMPLRIIFANGGGFHPATYARFDFIQHLQEVSYQEALDWGIPVNKMNVLCNYIPAPRITKSKAELRKQWGFTDRDWIVLCVAAWNSYHKRIDYLIRECASVKHDHLKLLLCGQLDSDSASLKRLAQQLMPGRTLWVVTNPDQVREAMALADVFVLPTINEYLGTVLAEAAMQGIPIVSHPHDGARFILGKNSPYTLDLSQAGSLVQRLREYVDKPAAGTEELRNNVLTRFSREKMTSEFVHMLHQSVARN